MFYKIIKNDIKNSKFITLATLLIISIASILVSLAVILGVNLLGAIDNLMDNAKTPHFMQMHSGEIDTERLERFSKECDLVDKYQTVEFLNIEGAKFIVNGKSLSDSVIDNGLSIQSKEFDYLLDLNNEVIEPKNGEIYLPITYKKENLAEVGDKVIIYDKEFKVAGFARDSQMNSSLASSKRYIVSEEDYNDLRNKGNVEYLIEFRLNNIDDISKFESEYSSAQLEANGPTITYSLFKAINAVSEGLMIMVILLSSILILAIGFMCIRFTLLAKIEDEYREIGIMKAIGLSLKDIKKVFLVKYQLIATIGCVLGYIISLPLKNALLENIRLYMGESKNNNMASIISIVGVVIVFLVVILYVKKVLRRFKNISGADALRSSGDKASSSKLCSIGISKVVGANVFMGIKDVFSRKKLYITMLLIIILSTFVIIVPQNLYSTISNKNFVTYMGAGNCDMRIDIQQTDNISGKAKEIQKYINEDKDIKKAVVSYTKAFSMKTENGSSENIKVELGDHSVFPVRYSKGEAPKNDNEIALSSANADELEKNVGDRVVLNINGKDKTFRVCGIYSDLTNGGKTAKATFDTDLDNLLWCIITIRLADKVNVNNIVDKYSEEFSYAKVSDIEEFINQTFGSTKDSIKMASYAAMVAAILITALVTALFLKMLVAKDKYLIAVMKALGFNNGDITIQYTTRAIVVAIMGIVLGTILSNTLGEILAGSIISMLGADKFEFVSNPIISYVLCPIMLICTTAVSSILSTVKAGKIKISDNIKEN